MAELQTRTDDEMREDAVNAVIAQTETVTDLNPHAVLTMMAAAMAGEVSGVQVGVIDAMARFYVTTAEGAALDRRLADFGVTRAPARASYGRVTFRRADDAEMDFEIQINAGFRVAAHTYDGDQVLYTVREAASIPANALSVSVVVDAVAAGRAGNAGAGAIDTIVDAPPNGLGTVTNLSAFTPGRDLATDEEFRAAFWALWEARRRTTPQAAKYGATTYAETGADGVTREPVASAAIVEYLDAPGPDNVAFDVIIIGHGADAENPGLTDQQVANVQLRIDGYTDAEGVEQEAWRPAGCKARVLLAARQAMDIRVRLNPTPTAPATLRARVRQAFSLAIAARPIGAPGAIKVLYDTLAAFSSDLDNATIDEPQDDVIVGPTVKLVPGQIEVL